MPCALPIIRPRFFQQLTSLVAEAALDLDQLAQAVQHRPDLMTRHALDLDRFVSTDLHDSRDPGGIVLVPLVDLQRERRLPT